MNLNEDELLVLLRDTVEEVREIIGSGQSDTGVPLEAFWLSDDHYRDVLEDLWASRLPPHRVKDAD